MTCLGTQRVRLSSLNVLARFPKLTLWMCQVSGFVLVPDASDFERGAFEIHGNFDANLSCCNRMEEYLVTSLRSRSVRRDAI